MTATTVVPSVTTAPRTTVYVDVRTPAEFASVHIVGSFNLPLDQIAAQRSEILPFRDVPVTLVCRTGVRSQQAATLLHDLGFTSVDVLEGGLETAQVEHSLIHGAPRWGMERQVRGVAGSLVLAGVLGSALVWRPLLALSGAIGGGLLFSALTDTCGMAKVLARLPYNRGASFSIRPLLDAFRQYRA